MMRKFLSVLSLSLISVSVRAEDCRIEDSQGILPILDADFGQDTFENAFRVGDSLKLEFSAGPTVCARGTCEASLGDAKVFDWVVIDIANDIATLQTSYEGQDYSVGVSKSDYQSSHGHFLRNQLCAQIGDLNPTHLQTNAYAVVDASVPSEFFYSDGTSVESIRITARLVTDDGVAPLVFELRRGGSALSSTLAIQVAGQQKYKAIFASRTFQP